MIYNYFKYEDIKCRYHVLDCMEVSLRWYAKTRDQKYLDIAKDFGRVSDQINLRIKNNDYREPYYNFPTLCEATQAPLTNKND